MLGLAQLGGGAIDLAARVDQFGRVKQVAAFIALIAAGFIVSADVTGALHIAVGQEAVERRGKPLGLRLGIEEAVFLKRQEHALGDGKVILGVGGGEEVVGDAQLLKQLEKPLMVAFGNRQGGLAFRVGFDGHRGAVRIGARDHGHIPTAQPVIAREDIPRQV